MKENGDHLFSNNNTVYWKHQRNMDTERTRVEIVVTHSRRWRAVNSN